MREGEAVQIVHPTLPVSISKTDLRDIEASRREETLRGPIQFDAGQPFDLDRGPLLRVKLIQIADDEHVLVLNLHHIVSDGWSMDVMFRELSVLYQGYCGRKPISCPTSRSSMPTTQSGSAIGCKGPTSTSNFPIGENNLTAYRLYSSLSTNHARRCKITEALTRAWKFRRTSTRQLEI